MLGCIEQQSPIEKLGLLTSTASNSKAVAQGPDPSAVETLTKQYFSRLGAEIPADIASELTQLAGTNAACAGAARADDREVLDVVARAQSRHVLNHLLANNYDELLEQLSARER